MGDLYFLHTFVGSILILARCVPHKNMEGFRLSKPFYYCFDFACFVGFGAFCYSTSLQIMCIMLTCLILLTFNNSITLLCN